MSVVNTNLSEVAIVLASDEDTDEFEKAAETCYKASECERVKNEESKKCLEALAQMKDEVTNLIHLEESKKIHKETVLGLESKSKFHLRTRKKQRPQLFKKMWKFCPKSSTPSVCTRILRVFVGTMTARKIN